MQVYMHLERGKVFDPVAYVPSHLSCGNGKGGLTVGIRDFTER